MEAVDPRAGRLADGEHTGAVFDSDEEQRALLRRFIKQSLASEHRIVYVADTAASRQLVEGPDVQPDVRTGIQRGQLRVLHDEDMHLGGWRFEPQRTLSRLLEEEERALEAGYRGVRITAGVSWSVRALPGVERLLEYEHAVGEALAGTTASALCQYDRRRLDDELIAQALDTHEHMTGGGTCGLHPTSPQLFRVLRAGEARFRLSGELDIAGTETLAETLAVAVDDGAARLTLDLEDLAFVDAAGAAVLCRPAVEGRLIVELRNPHPQVLRVLSLLRADRLPTVLIAHSEERAR